VPPLTSLAIALALAPAIVAWWTGRAVLTRVDDPILPELLFERRRRLAGFTLGGAFALAILFADDALWAIPLLWIALLVSSYPIRRALFGERWSAFAFLRYSIFSAIGQFGLWILAGFAPALVTSFALGLEPNAGAATIRAALWCGAAFGVVIALWQHYYPRVFLALHRATPLRDSARPELVARLDAIIERAGAGLPRRPETYRYGAPGAYVMNALAIPSLTEPAVALGDTLLSTLTDDEVAGVFAHEIAHHEQFTRARLWRSRCAGLLLAATAALLPALLLSTGAKMALPVAWCVPLFVILTLGKRAAKRRDAETASDLRASVLTENPTALASALTKLHVYSRVPRRWPHAIERAATHPSLARRIQALRERSGAIEPHVADPGTIVRSASGTVVALDRERVYWLEGVPRDAPLVLDALRASGSSYRAMAYRDLAELRVGAEGATGTRALVATDLEGRSWSAPLAPNDVAAVQAALDLVDVRLGHRRAAAVPASAPAVRWLTLALLVALAMAGELGVAVIPVLFVLLRPTLTAAMAATSAIALARLVVGARAIAWADPIRQLAAIGAAATAIALIVVAVRRARAGASRGAPRRAAREAWFLVAALGAFVAFVAAGVAPLASERPSTLVGNPVVISAAAALLGMGAALLTLPRIWWRASGVLVSGLALGGGALVSRDIWPFGRGSSLRWTTGSLARAGSVDIPGGGLALIAAPNGSAFAVTQYNPQRSRAAAGARYVIGRFDDSARVVRTMDAVKVAFADDETMLVLQAQGADSLEVRAERVIPDSLGGGAIAWRERFPVIDVVQMIVDRSRHSWLVIGRDEDERSFLVVSDTFAGARPGTARVPTAAGQPSSGEILSNPLAAFADGSSIWVTFPRFSTKATAFMRTFLAMAGSLRWELHRSDRTGDHPLGDIDGFPSCGTEVGDEGVVCVERSPNGTHVWRARSGVGTAIEQIGELPPSLDIDHVESSDRVVAAERFGSRLIVVDATARRATRLTLPGDGGRVGDRWIADAVARDRYVLVLTSARDGGTVSRFRLRN
jgi:Zn-dependent protease with chaperone function